MRITENTECLCLHIKTKEDWDMVTKKVLKVGWVVNDPNPTFEYSRGHPILYIGIKDPYLGDLQYSNIAYYESAYTDSPKLHIMITISELDFMINSGQLLVLLL